MSFNVGDWVKKHNGRRVAEVTHLNGGRMSIRYLHSRSTSTYEYPHHYVQVCKEDYTDKGEKVVAAVTAGLYEIADAINGTKRIGTKLMEKSKSAWIMEIKGSGEVVVVPANDCTEIVPYTIEVQFSDNTTKHYYAEPGQYAKGDLFIMGVNLLFARVTKVDSKGKALGDFHPSHRIVTTEV